MSYFKWRFLDSADFDSYKLFKIKNTDIQFIIKINNQNQNNFISVLTQTYTNNHSELIRALSTLALWCDNERFDYIDYYTNDNHLSSKLIKTLFSFRSYQNFAFHSYDKITFDSLKDAEFYFDYCDSDFEKYFE